MCQYFSDILHVFYTYMIGNTQRGRIITQEAQTVIGLYSMQKLRCFRLTDD